MTNRVFLLSPAYAGGQRARMIMSERAQFDLARRLRSEQRPTLGEVFTFKVEILKKSSGEVSDLPAPSSR